MLLAAIVYPLAVLHVVQALNLQDGIINRQLKRVVYLNSPVLREEVSLVVGLDEAHSGPIDNYLVIVPPSAAPGLAMINAIVDGSEDNRLPVAELPSGVAPCPPFSRCFAITLPKPLTRETPQVAFGLGITYVERYEVSPKEASQTDSLGIRVNLSSYFFSPYPTRKQKTVIMLIKEFELHQIHCPEPRNLQPTTSPSAVGAIPGSAQFTCGVYENVPALYDNPGSMWVSFSVRRVPFFVIRKLERTVEYDPLRGLLHVTEDYDIAHRGHRLRGEAFSRIQYMQDMSTQGLHGQVIPLIPLSVPIAASDIEVRDEVGLIHSPKPRRKSPVYPDLSHVIEVQPRFPLHGGWSVSWRVSYAIPAKSFLSRVRLDEKRVVRRLLVPLFEAFHDIAVQELTFKVIFPGHTRFFGPHVIATRIENAITQRTLTTQPSTLHLGHKIVASLSLKNACKEHHGYVAILFDVPWWSAYWDHVLLGGAIFLAIAIASRLLSATMCLEDRSTQEKDRIAWANMFRERRAILAKLETARNDKTKTGALLTSLREASDRMGPASSGKHDDGTLSKAMAALEKLYQEQSNKIAAILLEANVAEATRLEKDAVDIDARILRHEAFLLAHLASH